MNLDAINEAAEKILTKHSKNYTKWMESEKPLFNLQLNGHEALAAIKEAAFSDAAKQYWFEQFEQIACEFAKWHETLSLEQLVNLPTEDNSPYTTFNDAFKYFMENIYTLNKQTV